MAGSISVPTLIAFVAPRILNEPVSCRHSSLREQRTSACSPYSGTTGVARTNSRLRACAARASSSDGVCKRSDISGRRIHRHRGQRSCRGASVSTECEVGSTSCSAAGLAAKRTPAPGQATGAVDLPGVLATAGRGCGRIIGTLALQRLAELAPGLILGVIRLRRVLGTIRLRRGVSHAELLPGRGFHSLPTAKPGCRVGGGA